MNATCARIGSAAGLIVLTAAAGFSQPRQADAPLPARTTTAVPRATSEIRIDGVLDEPAWKTAAVVLVSNEWAPGDNIPAPVKTECLITFDRKNLYIAFRAADPNPSEIRAHLMDRDDVNTLIQDDHVGVMIDTFNDERRAFQFRMNPLGVQADAIFSEQDGVEDFSWDMIWASAGRITRDGYIVEVALPLKQLRFPAGQGPQTWGFEAFRSWPRNVRHRLTSQPRDRNKGCLLCQEGKITGLDELSQGRNIEIDPTATFHRTDRREDPSASSLSGGDSKADIGGTVRWNVTPNMTFSGTLNPDFSQVEADVAQLDVNQRFALFYPEKRPFFLEGVDFFTTPIQAVFTRTVADPYFGAKLTGKQGANAVGLFVTRDRVNSVLFPANQGTDSTSIDDDVTTVVGRYRRDIGTTSTIGTMFAVREGAGYHNRQLGADAFWRPTPSDSIHLQFLRTETQYPDEVASAHSQSRQPFGGNGIWADYQRVTRSYQVFANFESYDRGFRSDTGFVPRVDYRNVFGQAQRRWWRDAGAWFNTIDVGIRGWRTTDSAWTLTDQTVAAFIAYTGPFQTQAQFNMPKDVVVYQGVRYEYLRPNFAAGIKPTGNTSAQLTGRFGGGVDFANGRPARQALQLSPAVEYRPATRINLRLQYDLDQLSVDGGRLYRANLVQLKAIYHLNVRTFVRVIVQYTDIARDPALYRIEVERRTRQLFSQFLFSYKLNPQTVLFLGYSDNSAALAGIDLRRQDRTFFIKLGYAWVL
ncbi:MAG TPA: DUF5916 domain-containing protein [Vicinamibacterales bacterium]|jgi:hypothetical protein